MKVYLTAGLLALAAIGSCDLANFDSFKEGYSATQITDGGITFYNYDNRTGQPSVFNMSIDDASATLPGSDFSSPNVLNFGGYTPGPTAGAGRLGEVWFTNNHVVHFASLDVFTTHNANTLTLEGYLNGVLVDSTSLTDSSSNILTEAGVLKLKGTFDTFRLTSSGPADETASFGAIDNVSLNTVPEPASMLALALGIGALGRRKRKGSQS